MRERLAQELARRSDVAGWSRRSSQCSRRRFLDTYVPARAALVFAGAAYVACGETLQSPGHAALGGNFERVGFSGAR